MHVLFRCSNDTMQAEAKGDTIVKKEILGYPFTAKYSIRWQPGNEKNAVLVLNCLKKYVAGDIKGCAAYLADTSEFVGDKFNFKGGRGSLEKVIAAMRNASVSVSKEFDSWMTLYYTDKDAT